MGLWETLTGQKSSSAQQPSTPSSSPAPAVPAAPAAEPSYTFDPSTAQGTDQFLGSSSFADPTQLHPLAGLNKDTLDYLNLEDSALSELPGSQSVLPSRGFTDDLCYGTGVTYLAGLTLGGAWGLQEGLRRSADQPPKLRLNSVLNSVTRRGPFLGNSAGVVAIVYNCFNSYIGYARGKHDAANTILAGVLSGMVFKSTRGVRPMMISGGIVGSVAAGWAISVLVCIYGPFMELDVYEEKDSAGGGWRGDEDRGEFMHSARSRMISAVDPSQTMSQSNEVATTSRALTKTSTFLVALTAASYLYCLGD
ncbi:Tim17/Tim22/Tim23/Pmp24 family-domain-containing protein [Podospora australis]|uniref:Tim17/Tim22/Tim23/Pmp24 family-domain-containing protein n=1 Tax=Podospora australis TaxID=1536484 RepID=A0AAN7AL96_9PEZI|nr:Tim17/Tim22/Tim23/Pmp24 family-domain-containing protein [Podospora australis]